MLDELSRSEEQVFQIVSSDASSLFSQTSDLISSLTAYYRPKLLSDEYY